MKNSSFLLLYFFNLFSLLFLVLSLSLSFWHVIYYDFYANFSIHMGVRCSEFLCPLSPLLEPSTLSCKVASSLFRHHFHINVVRELAGQHLMRR